MGLAKKLSKNGITIILLHLVIKANKKVSELCKHIWEHKRSKIQKQINQHIPSRARPYNACTRKCDLCLTKKLAIANTDFSSLFNIRNDFISKCRDMKNFLSNALKTVKDNHLAIVKPSYSLLLCKQFYCQFDINTFVFQES